MAIYHLSVKPVARSAGRSATAAAAYRAGAVIACEREGRLHDYSRKQGIAHTEIIVPDGASWASDRSALWNAAEAAERRVNSTVAREYELALPAELSMAGRVALVRAFGEDLRDRYGVAVDIAIHAPHRDGDQRNWHAHVLTTTRVVEAEGLGAKTRILDDRKTGPAQVVELRETWAELSNRYLEREGFAERVDHRSLEAIRDGHFEAARAHEDAGREEAAREALAASVAADRPAQVHMGPAASSMERRAAREAREAGRAYAPETRLGAEVLRARQIAEATRDYLRSWTVYARARIEQVGARLEAAFERIKERFREPGLFAREGERQAAPGASGATGAGRSFLERRGEDVPPAAPDRPQESFLARQDAARRAGREIGDDASQQRVGQEKAGQERGGPARAERDSAAPQPDPAAKAAPSLTPAEEAKLAFFKAQAAQKARQAFESRQAREREDADRERARQEKLGQEKEQRSRDRDHGHER